MIPVPLLGGVSRTVEATGVGSGQICSHPPPCVASDAGARWIEVWELWGGSQALLTLSNQTGGLG